MQLWRGMFLDSLSFPTKLLVAALSWCVGCHQLDLKFFNTIDSNYIAITYAVQNVANNTRTSSLKYIGLQEDLENVDNLVVEKEAKPPEQSFVGFSTPAIPPIDSSGSLSPEPAIPSIDSSLHTEVLTTSEENKRPEQSQEKAEQKVISSPMPVVLEKNKQPEVQKLEVYTLSDMNKFLLESHVSYNSVIPRCSSPIDYELQSVKLQIENAPIIKNYPYLYAPLYHNVSLFKRSYELMEETLKVYIYREGERPILHTPVLGGIYASEGWFMKLLETNENRKNIVQYLKNYLDMIAAKYSYWNRTEGADHFLVACHDWATSETKQYMSKCIRALCNANVKEGFVFGKDVSLPETYIRLVYLRTCSQILEANLHQRGQCLLSLQVECTDMSGLFYYSIGKTKTLT